MEAAALTCSYPLARPRPGAAAAHRVSLAKCGRSSAGKVSKSLRFSRAVVCSAVESAPAAAAAAAATKASIKEFLEDVKGAGRIRIIVNTGVGVLESVTSLDKLFYSTVAGKGEYANVMNREDNVDFHLLVGAVASAKLMQGKSMRGDIPTYMIRLFDQAQSNVASLLIMWRPDTNGEYDPGQAEAFTGLLEKYGSEVSFT